MRTNAITRIIIYSVIIVLLLGILLSGMGIGAYLFNSSSGNATTGEGSVPAEDVHDLEIQWAAGSITIQTGDTDRITFTESGDFSQEHAMVYNLKNGTLALEYAKPGQSIGFGSKPAKDLTITVPRGWTCHELELDGAALQLDISGISVEVLQLDGAAMELSFTGNVSELDVDGAACELNITTSYADLIEIDGASCELNLTVSEGCGMLIQTEGLACDVQSNRDFTIRNGDHLYGDGRCKVDVDGISCQLNIQFQPQELLPTIP